MDKKIKRQVPKSKKVLIADDDLAIVDVTTQMLELEGYRVSTSLNGETIQTVLKELPDLILRDIWMGETDGRNICKYLKGHSPTKDIPIILISANKDARKTAREVGADDFIAKPFEMNDLLSTIGKYTW